MTSLRCHCGYYHYTFQHWSKVHGESKKFVDPYVKVPFVGDELWDENKYDHTEPYPLITWKWVCQFCGNLTGHQDSCSYLENNKAI